MSAASSTRSTSPRGRSNSDRLARLEDHNDQGALDRAQYHDSLPGAQATGGTGFGVANADKVEGESQRRQGKWDATFHHMDSDYELGFTMETAEKGTPRSTRIHMGKEDEEQRVDEKEHFKKTNNIDTLGEYRDMLLRDFSQSGVVRKYAFKGPGMTDLDVRDKGIDRFVKDVVHRFYRGKAIDDPEVQVCVEVARNIWSYATCGFDMSGTTDIGEMQGLLYVFDKEIQGSSNTNTEMEDGLQAEDYFVVPGTESWPVPIKLLKGDGRHGRATILTTRHLLAGMTSGPPDQDLSGFGESMLLLDRSPSMQADEYGKLAALIDAGGFTGDLALGGFETDGSSVRKVQKGEPMEQEEAARLLQAAGDVANGDTDARRTAPRELTDRITSAEEQGMAAALKWAESPDVGRADSKVSQQIVVVTDEPDFNPSVLKKLQNVARRKGLSIKVLYSFNSKNQNDYGSEGDCYVVVDVMAIKVLEEAWLVNREGHKQLDWAKVANSQHATVEQWGTH